MNDKELADAVVAHGVGDLIGGDYAIQHPIHKHWSTHITAKQFVTDWRVAGALMEKCFAIGCDICPDHPTNEIEAIWDAESEKQCTSVKIGDSFPRAIIEACCGVLS